LIMPTFHALPRFPDPFWPDLRSPDAWNVADDHEKAPQQPLRGTPGIGTAIAGHDRLGAMFVSMMPVDITVPEDVADTVLFLASDESTFITAHELAPDAGVTEF